MMPRPRRAAETARPDHAAELRRLHCARYDRCLDHAVRAGWPGFTCKWCGAYDAAPPLVQLRVTSAIEIDG